MFCRLEYARDDIMPADPRYATSHGICGYCKTLSGADLVVVTRRAWELAVIAALVARTEVPPKPNMVKCMDWDAKQ
jgi:hypothetical protein